MSRFAHGAVQCCAVWPMLCGVANVVAGWPMLWRGGQCCGGVANVVVGWPMLWRGGSELLGAELQPTAMDESLRFFVMLG